ncbi:hypothetical protein K503DRAFT_154235 [Rhizopogon vinicolor AM-OR11-026]|uniref:Nudix hydrolase domain-containing protein n=1 Tax=Rhizopogon vinicolor AM-OR11-026 TaxID=1314800 RepID=A0A1B7NEW5_9AGAM|nr:hypothetical protein K503DRAFT_154235 [Rhizopogon vinicolor AM-OR11-026]
MALGESPLCSVIREAEEASLCPESDYVSDNICPIGRVTFSHRSLAKWLLPGLYYMYDLALPADLSVRPDTNYEDGEVDHFELLSAQECLEKLAAREFKPSSGLAVVDFLCRHGAYATRNEEVRGAVLRGDLVLSIPC